METKRKGFKISGEQSKEVADLLYNAAPNLQSSSKVNENMVLHLELGSIQPGKYQPRYNFPQAEIDELADSILVHGLLQPIIVRKLEGNNYEIIAGERRWRACKQIHLKTIPAIVRDYTDKETIALSLIENIQRSDLNPIEEAKAYKRLLEEFNMTHEQLSESVGKSRSAISNSLRLLSLSDVAKQMLEENKFGIGHAKIIASLPYKLQEEACNNIVLNSYTVKQLENWIYNRAKTPSKKSIKIDSDTVMLKEAYEIFFPGLNVKKKGSNVEISLRYDSVLEAEDALNALLNRAEKK